MVVEVIRVVRVVEVIRVVRVVEVISVVGVVKVVLVVGVFEEAKCPKKKKEFNPLQDHAASGW